MTTSLATDDPGVDDATPPDPEVLIREARVRTRRRRAGYVAVVGLLTLGALVGLIAARGGSAELPGVTPRSPLTVDVKAFRGHGLLAFVSKGSLYVLDGATGRVAHLGDRGHTASEPTFSRDGRWLAYLELAGGPGPGAAGSAHGPGPYQLWIARSNGAGAHRIASVTNWQIVGWSPSRDVLAVINWPPPDWTCRSRGTRTTVDLLSPPASLRTVYTMGSGGCGNPMRFYGAVWSPGGGGLALATTAFSRSGGSRVFTIDLRTGLRRTWFTARIPRPRPGFCWFCGPDTIADLAGWWPKRGIGFWVFDNGMSANNDGSPFAVVGAPGTPPVRLGTSLSDGTQTAVAVSRTGAVAIVQASWRDIGSGGTDVRTCPTGSNRCAPVPGASVWKGAVRYSCHPQKFTYCYRPKRPGTKDSGISLDPTWSPNGTLLAYVAGPAVPQDGTPTVQWLNQHHLFLYNPRTGATRRIPDTTGASAPQWSADGRNILYVSHDSLWLLSPQSHTRTRIAGPLFGGASFGAAYNASSFYHQVPFTQQFGWWN